MLSDKEIFRQRELVSELCLTLLTGMTFATNIADLWFVFKSIARIRATNLDVDDIVMIMEPKQ